MYAIPDTETLRKDFTMSVVPSAAAGSVSQPFGTALAADERRMTQKALPAALTSEYRHFETVFACQHHEGKSPLPEFTGTSVMGEEPVSVHNVLSVHCHRK